MPASRSGAESLRQSPRAVRPGRVAVFGGWVLGQRWLETYDAQPVGDGAGALHLARLVPGRLHPRLLLPSRLLLWMSGEARNLAAGTSLASRLPPQEIAALIYARPVPIPLPCAGVGRCRVQVSNGQLGGAGSGTAEDVAAALLHVGRCVATSTSIGSVPPDWATCWLRDRRSVGELALHTAAWLQRASADEIAGLLDRLAGASADEVALQRAYAEKRNRDRHRRGWVSYKQLCHFKSRGVCRTCGINVHPATAPCHNCSAYPLGPDKQSSQLDRLERALGVDHPARVA